MIRNMALSFLRLMLVGCILNWYATTSFRFSRVKKVATARCPRLMMAADNEAPGNAVPMDSPEVKFVLGELMKTLEKSAKMTSSGASDANAIDTDAMMVDVDAGFAKILSEIKSSSKLTEAQKRLLAAETALTMSDAIQGDGNAAGSANPANNERIGGTHNLAKTRVYSQEAGPYLVVHGPGAVGRGVRAFMRNLASANSNSNNNNNNNVVKVKYLEAASLGTVPEGELEYAVRDCKSIIIAADAASDDDASTGAAALQKEKRGWGLFGTSASLSPAPSPPSFVVTEKSLKRLLNAAAMSQRRKMASNDGGSGGNVKVVALAAAAKEPKSFASLLGTCLHSMFVCSLLFCLSSMSNSQPCVCVSLCANLHATNLCIFIIYINTTCVQAARPSVWRTR
jgi:hypothetical protein